MRKIVVFIAIIFLAIGSHVSLRAAEEKPVTVLVAPFRVQSQVPIEYIVQAFLHDLRLRKE
jgi:hypothetical protein